MLNTRNEDYGFFGTARDIGGTTFATIAWNTAMEYIISFTEWHETQARDFLDSTYGRHYANCLGGLPYFEHVDDKIIAAIRRILVTHPWVKEETLCFAKSYDPEDYN